MAHKTYYVKLGDLIYSKLICLQMIVGTIRPDVFARVKKLLRVLKRSYSADAENSYELFKNDYSNPHGPHWFCLEYMIISLVESITLLEMRNSHSNKAS